MGRNFQAIRVVCLDCGESYPVAVSNAKNSVYEPVPGKDVGLFQRRPTMTEES